MCNRTTESKEKWKAFMLQGFSIPFTVLLLVIYGAGLEPVKAEARVPSMGTPNAASAGAVRKLLTQWNSSAAEGDGPSIKRIGEGMDWCDKNNILVTQGPSTPLPNGIPTYIVIIANVCMTGTGTCNFTNIHISCGWFSSARLIDPKVFRRLGYNDCLLKDGHLFGAGDTAYFEYANTYKYPMDVSDVSCLP